MNPLLARWAHARRAHPTGAYARGPHARRAHARYLSAEPLSSCGRRGRTDSRVIAIAMAAARTTRPASCPPIKRVFRGSVSETAIALIPREFLRPPAKTPAAGLAVCCGETVGNRPDGLLSMLGGLGTPGIPASGSTELMLGTGLVVEWEGEGDGVAAETTVTEPDALKDIASFALASAASVTWSPGLASFATATWACSSSACPCGRFPTAQVVPLASGQAENRGVPTPLACHVAALTVTCSVLPPVLQTQIA